MKNNLLPQMITLQFIDNVYNARQVAQDLNGEAYKNLNYIGIPETFYNYGSIIVDGIKFFCSNISQVVYAKDWGKKDYFFEHVILN